MLPKTQRVSRQIFMEVLAKGKSLHSKYLSLRFLKSKELKQGLFSFIVSSKISKKAPVRNLLKRRGYHIVRKNKKNISNQFVYLFFFKKDSLNLSFKELELEILSLLEKAEVLK